MVPAMEPHEAAQEKHRMVTFECPWCTEPAELEASSMDELACGACGIAVEIAPDPIRERIDRAA